MKKAKILSTMHHYGLYSSTALERITKEGHEIVFVPEADVEDRERLYKELRGVTAWVLDYTFVDEDLLRNAKDLKLIVKHGTGVNNIDLEACRRLGVTVCNTPGGNAEAVADLAFIMILCLSRKILHGDRITRSGGWDRIMSKSLNGQTLGIIGFGNIGKGVVRRLGSIYDMNYLAVRTRFPNFEFNKKYGVQLVDDYRPVLEQSDFILVSAPLNERTRNMIAREQFTMMKPNAYLIDVSRGFVVNQRDLVDAINNKTIAGAALDVYEVEPPRDEALLKNEHIILSPHWGGFLEEDVGKISDMTTDNILAFLNGQKPPYIVE